MYEQNDNNKYKAGFGNAHHPRSQNDCCEDILFGEIFSVTRIPVPRLSLPSESVVPAFAVWPPKSFVLSFPAN